MEILSTTTTNRQWPDDTIMPATARHRMEFWYYGIAESNLKYDARQGVDQRQAVEKQVAWVMEQVKKQTRPSYFEQNSHVFALVARNDIGQIAEDIYSNRVIKTEYEDVLPLKL